MTCSRSSQVVVIKARNSKEHEAHRCTQDRPFTRSLTWFLSTSNLQVKGKKYLFHNLHAYWNKRNNCLGELNWFPCSTLWRPSSKVSCADFYYFPVHNKETRTGQSQPRLKAYSRSNVGLRPVLSWAAARHRVGTHCEERAPRKRGFCIASLNYAHISWSCMLHVWIRVWRWDLYFPGPIDSVLSQTFQFNFSPGQSSSFYTGMWYSMP